MIDEKKLFTEINNFYYDKVFDGNYSVSQAFAVIMAIIGSQPRVGEWIPVSEKLPKESGIYLVTVATPRKEKAFTFVRTAVYKPKKPYSDSRKWFEYGRCNEVVAWMPLPEPYKESE